MQDVDRIRLGNDVSTPVLGSERADLAALISPSSNLSPTHTSRTSDLAHPAWVSNTSYK